MISRSTRYERWDGSQEPFGRDAEELFDRLAEDLFQGGDFDYALHRLMSRGWRDKQGRRLPGFEEMLERLRQKRLQQLKRYNLNDLFGNIREKLNDILRRELQALDQHLRDRLEGKTHRFEQFMQRFGHFFGPDPPKTLDELIQHLERQMAQMESLMQSLSPEMRQQMEELLASTLNDPELQEQMAELAAQLELLSARPGLGNRYAFYGSESLPLQEALSLMERLQGIEDLEAALREGYQGRQLTPEQSQQLQQLLGPDARQAADQMSELAAQLEKKGYVQEGRRGLELTPRGMRRIGQKALRDLYTRLKRDRFGDHPISVRGLGSERSDE